jgi:hypothetical protein
MLFEYYACVAETQYPAAHAGLLQSGALCPGPAHQRNCFLQFNQSLWALREYCINLRKKLNAKRHQGRRASVIAVIRCTLQFLYEIEFRPARKPAMNGWADNVRCCCCNQAA